MIKRYLFNGIYGSSEKDGGFSYMFGSMISNDKGDWVKWEDVKPIIERHDKLISKMVVDDNGISFTSYEWPEIKSYIGNIPNKYEAACKEFLTGCGNVEHDHQEECPECLKTFCDYIRSLAKGEKYADVNMHCLKPGTYKHAKKELEEKKCNCAENVKGILLDDGKCCVPDWWVCPVHGYKKR